MICQNCACKSECGYFSTNIEPVLNTEQGLFTSDEYLITLHKTLEKFNCNYYESENS